MGKWSVWLIVATLILFVFGSTIANSMYKSALAGATILADIATRPALALSMLAGMLAGVCAFITGLLAIFKQKERALLVYLSTAIGTLFTIFLLGEVLAPH
jgi:hypothetical protein